MGQQDKFFEVKRPADSPPPADTPGFFTSADDPPVYRGAEIAGKLFGIRGWGADAGAPGVIGQGAPGQADGVRGFGTGSFSGVAGWGDSSATAANNSNGIGVFGKGGAPSGPGVKGIGYGASGLVAIGPGNAVGVLGQGGPGNSDGVHGTGSGAFSGVAGFGDINAGNGTGVFGQGGAPNGPGVRGIGWAGPPTPAPAGNAVGILGQGGFGSGTYGSDGVLGIGSLGNEAGFGGAGVRGIGGNRDSTAQGSGFYVQSGVIGIGGGGPSNATPPEFNAVGVFGQAGPGRIAGTGAGASDGVYGIGYGAFSGVAGFGDGTSNSNGTGVFGAGGAPTGPGVRGVGHGYVPPGPEPAGPFPPVGNAVGVFGQAGLSHGDSDGVYGVGSGLFSGVAGFGGSNRGSGVFGLGGGTDGPGVRGIGAGGPVQNPPPVLTGNAVGVLGLGGAGNSDGVDGIANGGGHGVRGVSIGANGVGVSGNSNSGSGVYGFSAGGYGAEFAGGFAQLHLVPSGTTGHPTSGAHNMGEFYVDNSGSLFYCKANGVPGTWVKLA